MMRRDECDVHVCAREDESRSANVKAERMDGGRLEAGWLWTQPMIELYCTAVCHRIRNRDFT